MIEKKEDEPGLDGHRELGEQKWRYGRRGGDGHGSWISDET
jgi:hypothetical protein